MADSFVFHFAAEQIEATTEWEIRGQAFCKRFCPDLAANSCELKRFYKDVGNEENKQQICFVDWRAAQVCVNVYGWAGMDVSSWQLAMLGWESLQQRHVSCHSAPSPLPTHRHTLLCGYASEGKACQKGTVR